MIEKILQPTAVNLTAYTGEEIDILGSFQAVIEYGENDGILLLVVVRGEGPNLIGQDILGSSKSILG